MMVLKKYLIYALHSYKKRIRKECPFIGIFFPDFSYICP